MIGDRSTDSQTKIKADQQLHQYSKKREGKVTKVRLVSHYHLLQVKKETIHISIDFTISHAPLFIIFFVYQSVWRPPMDLVSSSGAM